MKSSANDDDDGDDNDDGGWQAAQGKKKQKGLGKGRKERSFSVRREHFEGVVCAMGKSVVDIKCATSRRDERVERRETPAYSPVTSLTGI
jgi:hypothetical protein